MSFFNIFAGPRKRGHDGTDEVEDASVTPSFQPDKRQAVAGPSRREFDEINDARKDLAFRLKEVAKERNAARHVNQNLENECSRLAQAVAQATQDGIPMLAGPQQMALLEDVEDCDQDGIPMLAGPQKMALLEDVENCDQEARITSLNEQLQGAREKNQEIHEANQKLAQDNLDLRSDFASLKETLEKVLQRQSDDKQALESALQQQRNDFEAMAKSHDDAIRKKDRKEAELQVEIQTLKQRLQRRPSAQQPLTQQSPPSRAQPHEDVDMDNHGHIPSPALPTAAEMNATIQASIAAAFAAQAGNTGTPRPTRSSQRKNQNPKERTPAHRRKVKREAFDNISESAESEWKALFRRCFRMATGRSNINDFYGYNPIPDDVAAAYERGNGRGPAELAGCRFSLYFGAGYHKSRWNKVVVDHILQMAQEESEGHPPEGNLDMTVRRAIIMDYIKQAQCSWASFQPRMIPGEDRVETPAEARARAESYNTKRSAKCLFYTRKYKKYLQRQEGVELLLQEDESRPLSSVLRRQLERARDINAKLGAEGQSSEEESETGLGVWNVKVPHYRRRIISTIMKDLDERIKAKNDSIQQQLGKPLREHPSFKRERLGTTSRRTVKTGLPRSLYHRRFLASLNAGVVDSLIDDKEIAGFDSWASAMQQDSDTDNDAA